MGIGCDRGPGLHLSDELMIIEPVDEENRPVPVGRRSSEVLFANPYNPALPLIRYELTHEITMLDERCPCGSEHRLVADPMGQLDDSFTYSGTVVHPHVFRSVLGGDAGIIEYQVRQTAHGPDIAIRGEANTERLRGQLGQALRRAGVHSPELTIASVEQMERQDTGKIR
jgi:phenylacetate-coenzyme A ligase PaaK-like adenylate-forming protein